MTWALNLGFESKNIYSGIFWLIALDHIAKEVRLVLLVMPTCLLTFNSAFYLSKVLYRRRKPVNKHNAFDNGMKKRLLMVLDSFQPLTFQQIFSD